MFPASKPFGGGPPAKVVFFCIFILLIEYVQYIQHMCKQNIPYVQTKLISMLKALVVHQVALWVVSTAPSF